MPDLEKLWTFWSNGALLLFLCAVAAGAAALIVGIPLVVGAAMLGYDTELALALVAYSAPIWLPVAVGAARGYMPGSNFRDVSPTTARRARFSGVRITRIP